MEFWGWDGLIPAFTPPEKPNGTALPAEAPDVRCYGEPEWEAFCEASDKPCSQSRAGSGVISGCTRERNPSLAHWIEFLFTRAWSLDSSNQSRSGTAGDGVEREVLKQQSCPACLPVCLSACALMTNEKSANKTFKVAAESVYPVTLSPINSPQ